jgi:hypothetical protein
MRLMAEDDRGNDDAADAGTEGGGSEIGNGTNSAPTAGAEAAGNDPAGFESSGVGDPRQDEGGGGQPGRAGDWNPGEQSGGGELY